MNASELTTIAAAPPRHFGVVLEFAKYFGASAAALGVDVGLLAASTHLGVPYPTGAAIAFLGGLFVAYLLSVFWVFESRSTRNGIVEFAIFAGIGVIGLGLTEWVLWGAIEHLHWSLSLAKASASGLVFLFNFGVRKALLFRGVRR